MFVGVRAKRRQRANEWGVESSVAFHRRPRKEPVVARNHDRVGDVVRVMDRATSRRAPNENPGLGRVEVRGKVAGILETTE